MLTPVRGQLAPLTLPNKAAGVSPLLDSLIACWKLDEASGDAADATGGGRTLTNVGVTYDAGKLNNCGRFVISPSVTRLWRADEAALRARMNMTAALWFTCPTIAWKHYLISKLKAGAGVQEYDLSISVGGQLTWNVYDPSAGASTVSTVASYKDASWHCVVVTVANGKARLSIDGDAFLDSSGSVGSVAGGDAKFMLGDADVVGGWGYRGGLDEVNLASRAWTATDVALFWNSGNGRTYPFS